MEVVLVILVVIIIGLACTIGLLWKKATDNTPSALKEELDTLKGRHSTFETNVRKLETQNAALMKEKEMNAAELEGFRAKEKSLQTEHDRRLEQLDAAKASLEETRKRLIDADEDKKEHELEERDRKWKEHEKVVQNGLISACIRVGYPTYYKNTQLPDGFDGSLKPDGLIEFLGQYVIFDAKEARSEDLQASITTAAKSTAKKIKNNTSIYSTVFLVVPDFAWLTLKTTFYHEEGFDIHIIPPQMMDFVLQMFLKLSSYDFAEKLDPEDREKLVSTLSTLIYHVRMRNSYDLIVAEHGVEAIRSLDTLPEEWSDSIKSYVKKMRISAISTAELTKHAPIEAQTKKIAELTAPEAPVERLLK